MRGSTPLDSRQGRFVPHTEKSVFASFLNRRLSAFAANASRQYGKVRYLASEIKNVLGTHDVSSAGFNRCAACVPQMGS
jgi:hypothetical protein